MSITVASPSGRFCVSAFVDSLRRDLIELEPVGSSLPIWSDFVGVVDRFSRAANSNSHITDDDKQQPINLNTNHQYHEYDTNRDGGGDDDALLTSLRASCWSAIHSNNSSPPPLVWRQIYERCGLIKAWRNRNKIRKGKRSSQISSSSSSSSPSGVVSVSSIGDVSFLSLLRSSLRELDLGILIGSDDTSGFNLHAQKMIQEIEEEIREEEEKEKEREQNDHDRNVANKRIRDDDQNDSGEVVEANHTQIKRPRMDESSCSSSSTSSSHLPPLPSHRLPRLPSSSCATSIPRTHLPSLTSFQSLYLTPSLPCVVEGAMSAWPALAAWNRDPGLGYFARIAGERTVPVEVGAAYTDESWTQELWTVRQFVEEVNKREEFELQQVQQQPVSAAAVDVPPSPPLPSIYLAQHNLFTQITRLRSDILTPDYCLLGTTDPDCRVWIGPAHTVSPLHRDPTHGILAQVKGRKYVRLYSHALDAELYPRQPPLANTSALDVESPLDPVCHPLAIGLPYSETILQPGELLFIPRGTWHYVRAMDTSASVSFWWT